MFVKITSSAGRPYVKLVEASATTRRALRTGVATWALEAVRAGDSNALIDGLLRARGGGRWRRATSRSRRR